MLHIFKDLKGLKVAALDEQVGEVKDVLFDDLAMVIRYFVVKTGTWLSGREVLISPLAIKGVHPERGVLVSILTKKEIEESPPIESNPPVSRQYEQALANYYSWSPYWGMPIDPAFGAYGMMVPSPEVEWQSLPQSERDRLERIKSGDPHLQSAVEIDGYALHALDGDIGHVKDLLVDNTGWQIKYLIVQTGQWLSRRKVVVDRAWIRKVEWPEREIVVTLRRQDIENAPTYDPAALGATYESDLTVYYKGLLDRWQENLRPNRPRGQSIEDAAAGHP